MTSLSSAELLRQTRALIEVAAWSELCDMVGAAADESILPRTLINYLTAALECGREKDINRACQLGLAAEIPQNMRIGLIRRLAAAGRSEDSWALIQCDKDVLDHPDYQPGLVNVLAQIAQFTSDKALAREARLLRRRLIGEEEGITAEGTTPFPKPATTAGHLASPKLDIRAASSVSPSQIGIFQKLADQHAVQMQRPAPSAVVREFRNVYANQAGQVWNAEGRLLLARGRPLSQASRNATEAAPRFAAGFLLTDVSKGFYHWFAERFAAMAGWPALQGAPMPLVFGSHAASFQEETVTLLTGKVPDVITLHDAGFFEQLHVPEWGTPFLRNWTIYQSLYSRIAENALSSTAAEGGTGGERLYLSRRDAPSRAIQNEAEVEAAMEARGFQCVRFTGLSVAQQIRIIRQASVIVAPHGAGLAHLLVAQSGIRIFEFMPWQAGTESLRFNFARISQILGHNHRLWLERVNPANDTWSITLPEMLAELDSFLLEAREGADRM
jgi:capsular polysaccharide biosynthesis protein